MEFLILADIHNNWIHLNEILKLAKGTSGVIFLGDLIQMSEPVGDSLVNLRRIYDTAEWMVAIPGNGAVSEIVDLLEETGINVHGASKVLKEIGFFGVGGVTDPVGVVRALRNFFKETRYPAVELNSKSLETLNVFGVSIRDGYFEVDEWSEEKYRELEQYRSPFEHTENEVYDILLRGYQSIKNLPYRILLSHVPPYEDGLNPILPEGVSTGSKSITKFILKNRPTMVLSGHYHRNYQFKIGPVQCAIVPAVKDDFYSILHFKPENGEFRIEAKKF